jgi:hypothetical protein
LLICSIVNIVMLCRARTRVSAKANTHFRLMSNGHFDAERTPGKTSDGGYGVLAMKAECGITSRLDGSG